VIEPAEESEVCYPAIIGDVRGGGGVL